MRQSARIVAQAVEKIPDGPIMAKLTKIIKPPVGDIYHSIEAPKGELGFYLISDGSKRPYRLRCRGPCFYIFQAFNHLVKGGYLSDAVASLGSFNIIAGELEK